MLLALRTLFLHAVLILTVTFSLCACDQTLSLHNNIANDQEGLKPGEAVDGIWISKTELMQLPTSGEAWDALAERASENVTSPSLADQDDPDNTTTMAKALVYARTGNNSYRNEVIDVLTTITHNNTENGGRTLALGRELIGYVIAADLIDLADADSALDADFRDKLRQLLHKELDGRTLVSTHEDRPNNWGTHAGGSRAAVARYLNDKEELARVAQVFKGFLGDRDAYHGFEYSGDAWQSDPDAPVGINPVGATIHGHNVDGVLPDDQRRAGGFTWPPPHENYVYEALQGVLAQAVILYRAGYDVWNWQDQAILRAFRWLHDECHFDAGSDDTWQPHIINFYYGTNFPAPIPTEAGKNVGFSDWTHPKP